MGASGASHSSIGDMLLSALLSLTSTSRVPILGALGRPAQAWFLEQVTRHRPALASLLHDENTLKPYSISTLLDDRGYPLPAGKWLTPGETCWLRIAAFGEEISDALSKDILRHLPKRMTLYKMDFRIDGVTFDKAQHPWAGQTSFSDIAQDAGYTKTNRQVRLEYVSPTAFRSSGNDIPLPLPAQVFRSYWQKWNAFCPEPMQIHDLWPSFAEECIAISGLIAINTERWKFAEGMRGGATGFTGSVEFILLPKSKAKKWAEYWDGADVVLQSLACFAFYCGTGHHTTIGMGQTRPIG